MSDSPAAPWSGNPYAPLISREVYIAEKTNFAGFLIGAMFYGIVIVLFFQCMSALLDPANRKRGGTKWGLVGHTLAMFSFVTIFTAINLAIQSVSYIDNRDFPGRDGVFPGPLGYQFYITTEAISVVPSVMFLLNNWLADGLLLYRCYVTYSMSYWIIAFPCLMFLATIGLGIAFIFRLATQDITSPDNYMQSVGVPYYTISVALNVVLTLMIVTRLILHSRSVRSAMGSPARTGGLYKAIVTMLVESCALYAVTYLLFIVPWAMVNSVANIFFPVLAETQVIAPLLVILRVANQKVPRNETFVTGRISTVRFENPRRRTGDTESLPSEESFASIEPYEKTYDKLGVTVETRIDLTHDMA